VCQSRFEGQRSKRIALSCLRRKEIAEKKERDEGERERSTRHEKEGKNIPVLLPVQPSRIRDSPPASVRPHYRYPRLQCGEHEHFASRFET
jgi:hypothetical protein